MDFPLRSLNHEQPWTSQQVYRLGTKQRLQSSRTDGFSPNAPRKTRILAFEMAFRTQVASRKALPEITELTQPVISICTFQPTEGQHTLELALAPVSSQRDADIFRPLHACSMGQEIIKMAEHVNTQLQATRDANFQACICMEKFQAFPDLEVMILMKNDPRSVSSEDLKVALQNLCQDCEKFLFAVQPPFEADTLKATVEAFITIVLGTLSDATGHVRSSLKESLAVLHEKDSLLDLSQPHWGIGSSAEVHLMEVFLTRTSGVAKLCEAVRLDGKMDEKLSTLLTQAATLFEVVAWLALGCSCSCVSQVQLQQT